MEFRSRLSGAWVKDGKLLPQARSLLRVSGLFVIAVGVLTLSAGLPADLFGVKAVGRVVEVFDTADAGPNRRVYAGVVEFADDQGRTVRVTRRFRAGRYQRARRLAVGDSVTVAFFRSAAEQAQVQDARAEWMGGWTALLVGALLFAVSFARTYRTG